MRLRILFLLCVWIGSSSSQLYSCPESWFPYSAACYQFNVYPYRSYVDAKQACGANGAQLLSVNTEGEHFFISQWLLNNDVSAYRWYTSGIIYDITSYDMRWEGDGTKIEWIASRWLNQYEMSKSGRHIVYTYGVYAYLWGRDVASTSNPYICEISQDDAYKILQEERDFDYGTNTSDIATIPQGPRFLIQPQSIVVVGQALAANFECVAYSVPQATYRIFRIDYEGTEHPVSADTDVRYTITNGRLSIQTPDEISDAGTYYCTAENHIGKVRSNYIQLTFGMLGDFSNVERAPVSADAFQMAVIDCDAPTYKPAVVYQWYKNDQHFVRPDLHSYMFISRNGKLYFSEVSVADAGFYRCIVKLTSNNGAAIGTNQPPSRTSLPIPLNVVNAVPTVWGPEISNDFIAVFPQTPKRGERVFLECLAHGTTPITYYWTREGLPMPPKATFTDYNRVLMLEDIQIEDGGKYTCHAARRTLARTHKNITLVIEAKPYFSYPLKNQHVDIGSKLTWRCEATAEPEAVYEWYRNGVKLVTLPGKLTVARNVLTIDNLVEEDEGMYQCSAENVHGKSFTEGQLRVLGFIPTFVKEPLEEKIYGALLGNVTIICNPEAAPTPTYKWLKNNINMGLTPGDTTSRIRLLLNGNLFIANINAGDAGFYTCQAENMFGLASSTGLFQISERAVISVPPVNTEVTINGTAFLRCQASYSPTQDVIYSWSFNGVAIDAKSDIHYTLGVSQSMSGLFISGAQFKHAGRYTCRTQTTQYAEEASATLTVLGPPGEPAGVFVIHRTITDTSMAVTWSLGATNGASIQYHSIQAQAVKSSEWVTVIEFIPESGSNPANDPSKRTVTVQGLYPGTGYKFRVSATSVNGLGPYSLPSGIFNTRNGPPIKAPDHVDGGGGSVGDLTIRWLPLQDYEQGGSGIGYNVYWRRNLTETWIKNVKFGNAGKHVTQVGQENFYRLYDVMVQAFNDFGVGPNSTVKTIYSAEEIPTITVTNIQAWPYNSTALLVTWDMVPNTREAMKGTLLGYQVNYFERYTDDPIINSISYRGQSDRGLVVGLLPEMWYTVTLQALNTAGMSQLSETDYQKTYKSAPILYPTEVHVASHGSQSVYVTWRGISTGVDEEPLLGYKVRYWPNGDNIRSAKDVIIEKTDNALVYGIQKDILYRLRVLAFSRGGDGTAGETIYFTLGGRVLIDATISEIKASASQPSSCVLTELSLFLMYIFVTVHL